jgi:hypothetical protein
VSYAHYVNLHSGDVPGFASSKAHPNSHAEDEAASRACGLGALSSRGTLTEASDDFKAGSSLYREQASSEVDIAHSRAGAESGIAALHTALASGRARSCMAREFDRALERGLARGGATHHVKTELVRSEGRVVPAEVGALPAGAGTAGGFTFRLAALFKFSARGRQVMLPLSVYLDARLFTVGRAQVSLSAFALGSPFPADLEARLLSTLARRAISASHTYPAIER